MRPFFSYIRSVWGWIFTISATTPIMYSGRLRSLIRARSPGSWRRGGPEAVLPAHGTTPGRADRRPAVSPPAWSRRDRRALRRSTGARPCPATGRTGRSGSGRYDEIDDPVDPPDLDLSPHHRFHQRERHLAVEVVALSDVARVFVNPGAYDQVPARAPERARVAFS